MSTDHVHTLVTALTIEAPFWRLAEACPGPWYALLDSALPGPRLGRWSFLLADVDLVAEARAADSEPGLNTRRREQDGTWSTAHRKGDPYSLVRALRAERGRAHLTSEIPFLCGAVGWFGHGAGRFAEDLPESLPDRDGLPDLRLMFGDVVAAHRPDDGLTWLATTGRGPGPDAARRAAEDLRDLWRPRFEGYTPPHLTVVPADPAPVAVRADLSPDAYAAAVAAIQQDILAGRVFEVNMTQTLEIDLKADPWTLYRVLRETNPAPFAAFLRTPDAAVVSSSPERYLALDREGCAESRPIKGTRPRGADSEADTRLRAELEASAKDRAENVMIVDLVRNDLGRVCDTGSVRVPELCAVEGYATVWQMVSTVTGRLRNGFDALDLVRACHPPGSMTGAPKIEALKVIDERETCRRGVYAGGIGYLDDGGAMDLHVVIRTAVVQNGACRIGVGGAVTSDSAPMDEYLESQTKAAALIRAVGLAEVISRSNR